MCEDHVTLAHLQGRARGRLVVRDDGVMVWILRNEQLYFEPFQFVLL